MPRSLERIGTYSDLPFRITLNSVGDAPVSSSQVAIRQSIFNIMNTTAGQRPLNPQFGANLAAYLFEPFDEETGGNIGNLLLNALPRWEPRIEITRIDVTMNFDDQTYSVNIFYRILTIGISDQVNVELQKL